MSGSRTEQKDVRKARPDPTRHAWTPKESALLASWGRRAEAAKHAHYLLASRLSRRSLWLGVPAVAASAVVGTSLFASLSDDLESFPPELRLAIGALSVLAAVLSAMQTFLRFSERSQRHVQAGDWYAAIKRKIELVEALPLEERDDPKQVLTEIRKQLAEAGQTYPEIGERIWHVVAPRYGVDEPPYEDAHRG